MKNLKNLLIINFKENTEIEEENTYSFDGKGNNNENNKEDEKNLESVSGKGNKNIEIILE